MVAAKALVLLSTLSTSVLAAEASRPRGVGPECKLLYDCGKVAFISRFMFLIRAQRVMGVWGLAPINTN